MNISCAMSCNEMAIKYKIEFYSATIRKKIICSGTVHVMRTLLAW